MSIQPDFRRVSPRLATNYAIFTSAFLALVALLTILEQLGIANLWLSHLMLGGPLVLYVLIGLICRTVRGDEFFTAGRQVPPAYGGFAGAGTLVGGVVFFSFTGTMLFVGYDGLALALGWCGGFLLLAVLFAPYLRKSGAYTPGGFLGARFQSRTLRGITALIAIISAFLLLLAEVRIGGHVASLFAALPYNTAIIVCVCTVIVTTVTGGMRSTVWSQAAQFIVAVIGLLVPVTILAVILTNLPIPQLTLGGLLSQVATEEAAHGIGPTVPGALSSALPGGAPEVIGKSFLQPFGELGQTDFILIMLCFMAGTAALPALLMRPGLAPTVIESRRTIGWMTVLVAGMLISATAYAAFAKFLVLREVLDSATAQLPSWIEGLKQAGIVSLSDRNGDGIISRTEFAISRDGVVLALPIMSRFPFIVVALAAAGGIAAALAAAAGHIMAIAGSLSSDLYQGVVHQKATTAQRLFVGRVMLIAAGAAAGWCAITQEFDILRLMAWSLSLSASGLFPVMLLAIWWRRATAWGAIAAAIVGFATAAGYIVMTEYGGQALWFEVSNLTAAVFGVPAALAAGIAVSFATKRMSEPVLDYVDELRVPEGVPLVERTKRKSSRARGPAPAAG